MAATCNKLLMKQMFSSRGQLEHLPPANGRDLTVWQVHEASSGLHIKTIIWPGEVSTLAGKKTKCEKLILDSAFSQSDLTGTQSNGPIRTGGRLKVFISFINKGSQNTVTFYVFIKY